MTMFPAPAPFPMPQPFPAPQPNPQTFGLTATQRISPIGMYLPQPMVAQAAPPPNTDYLTRMQEALGLSTASTQPGMSLEEAQAQTDRAMARIAAVNPELAKQLESQRQGQASHSEGFFSTILHAVSASPIGKALELITRPAHIIPEILTDHSDSIWKNIGDALTGHSTATMGDWLRQEGVLQGDDPFSKIARGVTGFFLDMATDPLTYVTAGMGALGRQAVTRFGAKVAAEAVMYKGGSSLLDGLAETIGRETLGVGAEATVQETRKAAFEHLWNAITNPQGSLARLGKWGTLADDLRVVHPDALGMYLGVPLRDGDQQMLLQALHAADEAHKFIGKFGFQRLGPKMAEQLGIEREGMQAILQGMKTTGAFGSKAAYLEARYATALTGGIRFAVPGIRVITPAIWGTGRMDFSILRRFFSGLSGQARIFRAVESGALVPALGQEALELATTGGWRAAAEGVPQLEKMFGGVGGRLGTAFASASWQVGGITRNLGSYYLLRGGGLGDALAADARKMVKTVRSKAMSESLTLAAGDVADPELFDFLKENHQALDVVGDVSKRKAGKLTQPEFQRTLHSLDRQAVKSTGDPTAVIKMLESFPNIEAQKMGADTYYDILEADLRQRISDPVELEQALARNDVRRDAARAIEEVAAEHPEVATAARMYRVARDHARDIYSEMGGHILNATTPVQAMERVHPLNRAEVETGHALQHGKTYVMEQGDKTVGKTGFGLEDVSDTELGRGYLLKEIDPNDMTLPPAAEGTPFTPAPEVPKGEVSVPKNFLNPDETSATVTVEQASQFVDNVNEENFLETALAENRLKEIADRLGVRAGDPADEEWVTEVKAAAHQRRLDLVGERNDLPQVLNRTDRGTTAAESISGRTISETGGAGAAAGKPTISLKVEPAITEADVQAAQNEVDRLSKQLIETPKDERGPIKEELAAAREKLKAAKAPAPAPAPKAAEVPKEVAALKEAVNASNTDESSIIRSVSEKQMKGYQALYDSAGEAGGAATERGRSIAAGEFEDLGDGISVVRHTEGDLTYLKTVDGKVVSYRYVNQTGHVTEFGTVKGMEGKGFGTDLIVAHWKDQGLADDPAKLLASIKKQNMSVAAKKANLKAIDQLFPTQAVKYTHEVTLEPFEVLAERRQLQQGGAIVPDAAGGAERIDYQAIHAELATAQQEFDDATRIADEQLARNGKVSNKRLDAVNAAQDRLDKAVAKAGLQDRSESEIRGQIALSQRGVPQPEQVAQAVAEARSEVGNMAHTMGVPAERIPMIEDFAQHSASDPSWEQFRPVLENGGKGKGSKRFWDHVTQQMDEWHASRYERDTGYRQWVKRTAGKEVSLEEKMRLAEELFGPRSESSWAAIPPSDYEALVGPDALAAEKKAMLEVTRQAHGIGDSALPVYESVASKPELNVAQEYGPVPATHDGATKPHVEPGGTQKRAVAALKRPIIINEDLKSTLAAGGRPVTSPGETAVIDITQEADKFVEETMKMLNERWDPQIRTILESPKFSAKTKETQAILKEMGLDPEGMTDEMARIALEQQDSIAARIRTAFYESRGYDGIIHIKDGKQRVLVFEKGMLTGEKAPIWQLDANAPVYHPDQGYFHRRMTSWVHEAIEGKSASTDRRTPAEWDAHFSRATKDMNFAEAEAHTAGMLKEMGIDSAGRDIFDRDVSANLNAYVDGMANDMGNVYLGREAKRYTAMGLSKNPLIGDYIGPRYEAVPSSAYMNTGNYLRRESEDLWKITQKAAKFQQKVAQEGERGMVVIHRTMDNLNERLQAAIDEEAAKTLRALLRSKQLGEEGGGRRAGAAAAKKMLEKAPPEDMVALRKLIGTKPINGEAFSVFRGHAEEMLNKLRPGLRSQLENREAELSALKQKIDWRTNTMRDVEDEWARIQHDVAARVAEPKVAINFGEPSHVGMSKVMVPGLENMYMPAVMADEFNIAARGFKGLNEFQKVWRRYLSWWKEWATWAWPGFHVRNAMGGWFNNWLGGVEMKSYFETFRAIRARHEVETGATAKWSTTKLSKEFLREHHLTAWFHGMEPTYQDLADLFVRNGINTASSRSFGEARVGAELLDKEMAQPATSPWTLVDRAFGKNVAAGKPGRVIARGLRGAGEMTENMLRGAAFLRGMKVSNGDFMGAHLFTMMRHGDYGDLSDWEYGAIRDVLPFYKWMRTNLPLQIHTLFERPVFLAAVLHAKENAWNAMGIDYAKAMSRMPSWALQGFSVPAPGSTDDAISLVSADLPMNDLYQGAGEFISQMLPLARPFLESYVINKSLFTGKPIEGAPVKVGWVSDVPFLGRLMSGLGVGKMGPDGSYYIDDKLQNVIGMIPVVSRFRNWLYEDPSRAKLRVQTLFSAAAGIGVRPFDDADYTSAENGFYFGQVLPQLQYLKEMGYPLPTTKDLEAMYGASNNVLLAAGITPSQAA